MTNAGMNGINVNRLGVAPRNVGNNAGRGGLNFGAVGDIFSAVITQKNANGTTFELADGRSFSTKGDVLGNMGDTVFFEVVNNDGNTALKQVFPNIDGQNFLGKHMSLQNLQDLMIQKDYAKPTSSFLDVEAITQEKLDERQRVNDAANRMKRGIGRIAANAHSAAAAQLAAEGISIEKMPVDTLGGVVSQLEGAQANNEARVYEELTQKLANVSGLNDGQITQALGNEAELTLDNLYVYKHSGAKTGGESISQNEWQQLQADIARFLNENDLDNSPENLARVRLLLDNQVPLNIENFDKLMFLQDIDGNVDAKAILPYALEADAAGKPLGELNIYNAQKNALLMAETRLAMSYEANAALLGTELEMDLQPQIDAVKALKELAADTPENIEKVVEATKAVAALPQTNLAGLAAIAQNTLDFTPIALNSHNAAAQYDQNATMVSLKYGDTFAKIAEQFAPMLRNMGFADDAYTIRAAKVLTANNMDINAENLAKIKDITAKIEDVQTKLHPRIAAAMVVDGMTPQNMQMDDILQYIEQHNEEYGKSTMEQLLENIAKMDKEGDVPQEVRETVMQVYQMLYKVSKNNSAGVGFAVNAGIDLTLENLMEFSKNFDATKARSNAINYAVTDGVYFAKHLVSSFAQSAAPKPLAAFVAQKSLQDPLAKSVENLQEIVKNMPTDEAIDIERVNDAVKELSAASKDALQSLAAVGVPVTLVNLRQMKALKDKKMENDVAELDNDTASEILSVLPKADFESIDAIQAASDLEQAAEILMDEAVETGDTQKISQLDIILQQLGFREMMLENDRNHSFAMNFNNRLTDVKMHVLSDEMDVEKGVTAYLSLSTAMGEVEGLIKIKGDDTNITIAADTSVVRFLRENANDSNIQFVEKKAFKNQLSLEQNLPIY